MAHGGKEGKTVPAAIPRKTYFAGYLVHGFVMGVLLTDVPVYLRDVLNLDWYAVMFSFIVALLPVLLKPCVSLYLDEHVSQLGTFLVLGLTCVVPLGVLAWVEGIPVASVIAGLSLATLGVNFVESAVSCHVLHAVPTDMRARINAILQLGSFAGLAASQICFFLLITIQLIQPVAWQVLFSLPTVLCSIYATLFLVRAGKIRKGLHVGNLLPLPQGNKPSFMVWPKLILSLMVIFTFMANIDKGLSQYTLGPFLVEEYGAGTYAIYSLAVVVASVFSAIGYGIGGYFVRGTPEKWMYVASLCSAGYYIVLLLNLPAWFLFTIMLATQVPLGIVFVKLYELWQKYALPRLPGTSFQVFNAVFSGGSFFGLFLAGPIMVASNSYTILFAITAIITLIPAAFILALQSQLRGVNLK